MELLFTKKYKYWKQATARDRNDFSTDFEHTGAQYNENNFRFFLLPVSTCFQYFHEKVQILETSDGAW